MQSEELTSQIIGAAIEVHRYWGPGLLESIYEKSLCHELHLRKIQFKSQVDLPLVYKGEKVGEELRPIHKAQLLTYMKLMGCKIGLLINFNVAFLADGVKRMVL